MLCCGCMCWCMACGGWVWVVGWCLLVAFVLLAGASYLCGPSWVAMDAHWQMLMPLAMGWLLCWWTGCAVDSWCWPWAGCAAREYPAACCCSVCTGLTSAACTCGMRAHTHTGTYTQLAAVAQLMVAVHGHHHGTYRACVLHWVCTERERGRRLAEMHMHVADAT